MPCLYRFLLCAACCALCVSIQAQPFTKVTAGPPVTDGGDSRSVNFVDYDNDGDPDLFVANGTKPGVPNFLYRNEGNGSFAKITDGILVTDAFPSVGTTWGDYDNDGDLDLFVTNWYGQPNNLYANNGDGSFTKITEGTPVTDLGYSEAATWGDYDNDGDLDLFVTNSARDLRNALYANDGNGSFTRIMEGPLATDVLPSRSAHFVDYDNDGDLDLFVTNEYNQANHFYQNRLTESGHATFAKQTTGPLVEDTLNSNSASWGDYDNDGDLDVFIANAGADEANALYINNGNGTFEAVMDSPVVTDGGSSFGSAWGDYDNDGDLDLFVTNAFRGTTTNFLYANNGDGTFERIRDSPIATDSGWTYGATWADYDNDGDLDLFAAKVDSAHNVLYRNDATHGRHWLLVSLEGTTSNRSAIGATVHVRAGIQGRPIWQMREVTAQSGYTGQNLRLHFGLDDAVQVDTLAIRWPSGQQQVLTSVRANQRLFIREGAVPTSNTY